MEFYSFSIKKVSIYASSIWKFTSLFNFERVSTIISPDPPFSILCPLWSSHESSVGASQVGTYLHLFHCPISLCWLCVGPSVLWSRPLFSFHLRPIYSPNNYWILRLMILYIFCYASINIFVFAFIWAPKVSFQWSENNFFFLIPWLPWLIP